MDVIKTATFSECRTYRYTLTRIWERGKKLLLVIGLNPSTADENKDDPTVRKWIKYAKREGFGGIIVVNLFAFRATNPEEMKLQKDPIGPDNDGYIKVTLPLTDDTLISWGVHGSFKGRAEEVLSFLNNPKCLGISKNGQPLHPLYQKDSAAFIEYTSLKSSLLVTADVK